MVSEATSRRAPSSAAAGGNIPTHDKGKRNIVHNAKAEQSCRFKAYQLVKKEDLEIEAKR